MIIQTSRQYIDARTYCTQILSCEEIMRFGSTRSIPRKTVPTFAQPVRPASKAQPFVYHGMRIQHPTH